MNLSAWSSQRRLVPPWRSLAFTLRSRELISVQRRSTEEISVQNDFAARLARWRISPSLISAAELVEIAIIEGQEQEAIDAARRLVSHDTNAAPLIRLQAAELLRRQTQDAPDGLLKSRPNSATDWRYLTRINPRDPLAWVELALHQTIAGHNENADRSMTIAIHLAPDNRHVLRSASRLFLHLSDPERAHDTILRSPATRTDPWLLTAEIVLSELAGRYSRTFKTGLKFIEERQSLPRQFSELAGAIATADLIGGGIKRSRKMFQTSMIDPTANALAQGEWASNKIGQEIVSKHRLLSAPEAYEAQAFHLYRYGFLKEIPAACKAWASVDQFSLRPLEFGAVAASLAEDFVAAENFASLGLKRHHGWPLLINMRAFALASLGLHDGADQLLRNVDLRGATEEIKYLTIANRGLVAFRCNNSDLARSLYLQAIGGFTKLARGDLASNAQVYFAREAYLANQPDALGLLREAQVAARKSPKFETNIILQRVERMMGIGSTQEPELSKKPATQVRPAFRWRTPGVPDRFRTDSKPFLTASDDDKTDRTNKCR